jgi:tocopherol cyclase
LLTNILHPNQYHGFTASPPFFEGWYYKLVSADTQTRFAVIPGVYLARDHQKSHCFVQVFDSKADRVRYHRYPFKEFQTAPDSFELFVGPNYFSSDMIHLAIDDQEGSLVGSLRFSGLSPWPVRFYSPGAMGWFAWVPFMECYHGVVSMDHAIQGKLTNDGELLDFTGGRGYIEKDWGKQFPSAWIWGQSNHFEELETSIMLSVAVIPWLGWSFGGFIIGLLFDGVIHRFASYNRSRIEEISIKDNYVNLVVSNTSHRLWIRALRGEGGLLKAPSLIEMDRRIMETLNASIEIQFETLSGKILYKGTGDQAGLETVGDLDNLIQMIRKKRHE